MLEIFIFFWITRSPVMCLVQIYLLIELETKSYIKSYSLIIWNIDQLIVFQAVRGLNSLTKNTKGEERKRKKNIAKNLKAKQLPCEWVKRSSSYRKAGPLRIRGLEGLWCAEMMWFHIMTEKQLMTKQFLPLQYRHVWRFNGLVLLMTDKEVRWWWAVKNSPVSWLSNNNTM